MDDSDKPAPRRRAPWLVAGGIGAFALALYIAGVLLTDDRIPSGTKVAGVDIGGLTPSEAERAVETRLTQQGAAPITLVTVDGPQELDPGEIGLEPDVAETIAAAGGGRTFDPVEIVDRWVGSGGEVDIAATVDEERLAQWAEDFAAVVDRPAREPAVAFAGDGTPRVQRPVAGYALDQEATAEAVAAAYLSHDAPVDAVGDVQRPEVDAAEFRASMAELVRPATSAPITAELPGRSVPLRVRDFAPALSFAVVDGELAPVVDADLLDARLSRQWERFGEEPVDATVELRDGKPVVVPAQPGVAVDAAEVADALPAALGASGAERAITVGQSVAAPDVTTKEARGWGIREVVSEFTTYYPHAEYRNVNQGRAAELINGTVLEPGELFSFNDTVGERTVENGFVTGFIISNGVFQEDLGGGVSQVVTTTYNASFFAGLEDVEHKPHSFYIDRYPLGREATVAWPTVDLQFRNTTPHGVLIEAWVVPSTTATQGEMHVRMWSTEHWDIESRTSDRYNFTSPSTRYDSSSTCVPTTGYGGFDVDVTRVFRHPGSDAVVKTERDHVTYIPLDTVICSAGP